MKRKTEAEKIERRRALGWTRIRREVVQFKHASGRWVKIEIERGEIIKARFNQFKGLRILKGREVPERASRLADEFVAVLASENQNMAFLRGAENKTINTINR